MSLFTNIHRVASRVIPRKTIKWRKGAETEITDAGIAKSKYGDWIEVRAHVQPGIVASFGSRNIDEKNYKDMGLDWSKRTMTVWIDNSNITTVANQSTTDQFMINGEIFNIIQIADWLECDGWKRCYCEQVIDS